MTPEKYLKECLDLTLPVGYNCCQIDQDAVENNWTIDQVVALKQTVEKKYRENAVVFPFPRVPRYV